LDKLTNPLSEDALCVKMIANGVKIRVESQEAKKGDMLLSSAAFVLNNPM
jgi:hypothetical protein